MRGFDKSALNQNLLLSIPMYEGTGSVSLMDVAKPHHPVTQIHAPVWTQLASGLWVLQFAAGPDYLSCAAASSLDLNFTSESFSGAVWFNCGSPTSSTGMLMQRWNASGGWYWYLDTGRGTFFRTYQGATVQISGKSTSWWTPSTWTLCGFRRSGTSVRVYLNGVDVTDYAESHVNPTSVPTADLGIGYASDRTFVGYMSRPRIWNRALSTAEHMEIFNREREWFNV